MFISLSVFNSNSPLYVSESILRTRWLVNGNINYDDHDRIRYTVEEFR